jgi:hypothetical protein
VREPGHPAKWSDERGSGDGRKWADASYLLQPCRRGYVYRLWGATTVIYIGQTVNLRARMDAHAKDKPWWPEVRAVEYTVVSTGKLDRVEREQIRLWSPEHNKMHKPASRNVSVAEALVAENRRIARVVRSLPSPPPVPAPRIREEKPAWSGWVDETDPGVAVLLADEA